MKSQLLEDMGQSATLCLVPSDAADEPLASKAVQIPAPARPAKPARPRAGFAVWRQKPADAEPVASVQAPDQQVTSLELDNVFEEIAAMEAQYVDAAPQQKSSVAPDDVRHALAGASIEPPLTSTLLEAEPTLASNATQGALLAKEPFFDFTLPSSAQTSPDPFTPASTGFARSGQRYLLWGACLIGGVLLVQGGRWLYQDRDDSAPLAAVADEVKAEPQVDKAAKRRAIAAKEFTLGPNGDVRVTPVAPPAQRALAVPPLVLLETQTAKEFGNDQPSSTGAERGKVEAQTMTKSVAVERKLSTPLPKASPQPTREKSDFATARASTAIERGPTRQLARLAANTSEIPAGKESTTSATLKACREYGYSAAQCVKRACSVTKYGFVCRGQ